MRILFLLLLIVPLIELYFLIQLGDVIGALPTVLLTIFTAVVGVALMRTQGLAIMQRAQQAMAEGRPPQTEVMEGVFVFLGGVFLFFPGLISDSIGFLFLIPFVRQFLIAQSLKGMATKARARNPQGDYYEGEWTEGREPERKKLPSDVIEGELEEPKKPLR
ncbi:MAG: FxsA family protein [Thiomicrorhabdus sp.]|nr:FxsA family protein [Thiomicrorhabdus sp.]